MVPKPFSIMIVTSELKDSMQTMNINIYLYHDATMYISVITRTVLHHYYSQDRHYLIVNQIHFRQLACHIIYHHQIYSINKAFHSIAWTNPLQNIWFSKSRQRINRTSIKQNHRGLHELVLVMFLPINKVNYIEPSFLYPVAIQERFAKKKFMNHHPRHKIELKGQDKWTGTYIFCPIWRFYKQITISTVLLWESVMIC